jgi:hypothetical protein
MGNPGLSVSVILLILKKYGVVHQENVFVHTLFFSHIWTAHASYMEVLV